MVFKTHSSMNFQECPDEIVEALGFLVPKAFPGSLERYGGSKDGAYLLPEDLLDRVVACFSPGVRNSKLFEDDLADRRGVRSYLLDASSDPDEFSTPLIEDLQTFDKKWLSASSSDQAFTLSEWVERYEPNSQGELMLQMDIEGAEWEILERTPLKTLRQFMIITVELHKLDTIFGDSKLFQQSAAVALSKLKGNFTVIHAHPNNCCGTSPKLHGSRMRIPRTLELTLVRTDVLEGLPSVSVHAKPQLPHPLDIWRNVPGTPPIFLGDGWRQSPIPFTSLASIVFQKGCYELLWRWKRLIPRSIYFLYRDSRTRQRS